MSYGAFGRCLDAVRATLLFRGRAGVVYVRQGGDLMIYCELRSGGTLCISVRSGVVRCVQGAHNDLGWVRVLFRCVRGARYAAGYV